MTDVAMALQAAWDMVLILLAVVILGLAMLGVWSTACSAGKRLSRWSRARVMLRDADPAEWALMRHEAATAVSGPDPELAALIAPYVKDWSLDKPTCCEAHRVDREIADLEQQWTQS